MFFGNVRTCGVLNLLQFCNMWWTLRRHLRHTFTRSRRLPPSRFLSLIHPLKCPGVFGCLVLDKHKDRAPYILSVFRRVMCVRLCCGTEILCSFTASGPGLELDNTPWLLPRVHPCSHKVPHTPELSRQTPQSRMPQGQPDALPLAALAGPPVGPRSYQLTSLIRSHPQRRDAKNSRINGRGYAGPCARVNSVYPHIHAT